MALRACCRTGGGRSRKARKRASLAPCRQIILADTFRRTERRLARGRVPHLRKRTYLRERGTAVRKRNGFPAITITAFPGGCKRPVVLRVGRGKASPLTAGRSCPPGDGSETLSVGLDEVGRGVGRPGGGALVRGGHGRKFSQKKRVRAGSALGLAGYGNCNLLKFNRERFHQRKSLTKMVHVGYKPAIDLINP